MKKAEGKIENQVVSTSHTKKCSTCGISKTISEFSKRSINNDSLQGLCKSCQSIRSKKYEDRRKSAAEQWANIF